MAKYIGNAFSMGMLDCLAVEPCSLDCEQVSVEKVGTLLSGGEYQSCVGHADTALLYTSILGVEIAMNRVSTSLQPGDEIIVGQYNGPRLPEGATALPEGAKIRWILVRVR